MWLEHRIWLNRGVQRWQHLLLLVRRDAGGAWRLRTRRTTLLLDGADSEQLTPLFRCPHWNRMALSTRCAYFYWFFDCQQFCSLFTKIKVVNLKRNILSPVFRTLRLKLIMLKNSSKTVSRYYWRILTGHSTGRVAVCLCCVPVGG